MSIIPTINTGKLNPAFNPIPIGLLACHIFDRSTGNIRSTSTVFVVISEGELSMTHTERLLHSVQADLPAVNNMERSCCQIHDINLSVIGRNYGLNSILTNIN